jgi:RNA polymerase sigma-70 factor (ECF subfamily)
MERRDEELGWIRRSREGDLAAFEELIRRYQQMIHALTFRMTGSMSDAEDLAQEVFIQAFRKLDGFRGDSQFSTWLYRIGINTCLNWRKSQLRRAQMHEEWANQPRTGTEANTDLAARVQEALLALPPKQRAAVILTTYEGLNHAEAARALGCSETTVSWRVFTARKLLKKWLQSDIRTQ